MAVSPGGMDVRRKADCCAGRVVATRADSIVASSVGWRVGQKADCWADGGSFSMTEVTGQNSSVVGGEAEGPVATSKKER